MEIRPYLKAVLVFLCAASCAGGASANELDFKLEKTARKIAEAAVARDLSTSTLAVFPFQADERLSKERVNFAIGEILTKELLKQGTFRFTERSQLEEVLKEQKLALSGAVDSKTAAGIGKLAGARLLVLGNVIRLGNSYQITAKLADSETGELITSEIMEVPVKTFEEDAGNYLTLVPETQTIGVFVAMKYGVAKAHSSPAFDCGTLCLEPKNPSGPAVGLPGIGLRYWISRNYMLELSFVKLHMRSSMEIFDGQTALVNLNNDSGLPHVEMNGEVLDMIINRTVKLTDNLKGYGGIGFSRINLGSNASSSNWGSAGGGANFGISFLSSKNTLLTPLIRAGAEWRPQQRLGFGIFSGYNIVNKRITQKAYLQCSGATTQRKMWQADLPRYFLESTLSMYF